MQLQAMEAIVTARLAEGSAPVAYPTSEIAAALNEANRLFVLLTLGLETTQPWTVPPATTFFNMLSVFPDWIVPLRFTTSTGAKVRPARVDAILSLDASWTNSPGPPQRYAYLGSDFIALYQQPPVEGTILQVTYARAAVALVNATDTPEVPEEYHHHFPDYAVYRCRQWEGGEEFQKTLDGLNGYFDAAQHYADYVRSRNLASRYDRVPFELQKFDRSRLVRMRTDLVPGATVPEVNA